MKLSFRIVAISIAVSFVALALALMLAPRLLLAGWGLEFTLAAGVLTKRVAALLAGIAVMLFSARNAEPSLARSALIKGLVTSCLMLAAFGSLELAVGHVTSNILIAVFIEVTFAIALLYVGRGQSKAFDSRKARL
jgi:hypothetical protein